ncbi:MAG: class I SAM-dependent methyltransferase [Oscillospiraceae bacterium]|nr:class I SAM-dependent methyltransferase [Oscillospiraceae bacterium]
MEQILIFGTGSVSEYIFHKLDQERITLLGFLNTRQGMETFHGLPVLTLDAIDRMDYDAILIASGYVEPIMHTLICAGVPAEKIVAFIYDDISTYQALAQALHDYLDTHYHRSHLLSWLKEGEAVSNFYPAVFWDDRAAVNRMEKDFVREQTTALLAKQIQSRPVPGNVAELGVFRGDFTVVLHRLFPDRILYLYDTFEGFADTDVQKDKTISNKIGEAQKFKDTSVSLVLDRLGPDARTVVNKGYFPDTFREDIGDFCFVSIDFNLYDPVIAALERFYPHLAKGGVILVSDYHAPFYDGTRQAVDAFCAAHGKTPIPIADLYGSVLIVKE